MPTTAAAPKHNATAARFYSMDSQGKSGATMENILRDEKYAEDATADVNKKAQALKTARNHLQALNKDAQDQIGALNKIMSDANDELNTSDLALAGVSAVATLAILAAAIVAAPEVATAAGIVVVFVGVGGMITDANRQEKDHPFSKDVEEGAGKAKTGLEAGHSGEEVKELLKPAGEAAHEVSGLAKVASTATAVVGGALETYERLDAAETKAYQLPDPTEAGGALDNYEMDLYNYSPTPLEERGGFTSEARDNVKCTIDDLKKARSDYQKALAAYKAARSLAIAENATFIANLSKAAPPRK